MKVKIIGGFGGPAPGKRCTSILIDGKLLLDLGAASVGLSATEKKSLKHIFLSHVHFDHIKELPHICQDLQELGVDKVEVYCNKFTEQSLRRDIFNNILYPDITAEAGGPLSFKSIKAQHEINVGEYRVLPVSVNHPCDAYGFIVKKGDEMIFFTLDTGSCESIWTTLKAQPEKLKAIFFDLSFPNKLLEVAKASGHHTAETFAIELSLMPQNVPLYATHVKPNFLETVTAELKQIGHPHLEVISSDNLVFDF